MNITLYDQIILLDETTGTGRFVGLLFENDGNETSKNNSDETSLIEGLINALSGKSENLKKEVEEFQKYRESLKKNTEGKFSIKQIASFIKLVSMYILRGVGFGIEKLFAVLDWLWGLIKKIPGISTLSKKLYDFFFMNSKGKVRTLTIGKKEYPFPQVIKAVISGIVLGAISGKLIALLKEKLKSRQEESVDIITEPLIIPFNETTDDNVPAETFVKRSPGVLSRILNFLSNVKDESIRLIVGTLAVLVTLAIFFAILLGLKPLICKTVRYTVAIRKIKVEHNIAPKGFSIVKLGIAQIITSMIEMLEKRNILSGYLEMCDCVKIQKRMITYSTNGNCEQYYKDLYNELKNQQQGKNVSANEK